VSLSLDQNTLTWIRLDSKDKRPLKRLKEIKPKEHYFIFLFLKRNMKKEKKKEE